MADILILVTTTAIVIFHDAASSSALAYPRPRWTSHHPLVSPSLIAIGGIVVLGASSSSSSSSHAMDEWHDLDRAEEDEGDDDDVNCLEANDGVDRDEDDDSRSGGNAIAPPDDIDDDRDDDAPSLSTPRGKTSNDRDSSDPATTATTMADAESRSSENTIDATDAVPLSSRSGSSSSSRRRKGNAATSTSSSTAGMAVPDIVDRFSRAIAGEIVRRFPSMRGLLRSMSSSSSSSSSPIADPGGVGEGGRELGDDGTGGGGGGGRVSIQTDGRIVGAWCPPPVASGEGDANDVEAMDRSVVVARPSTPGSTIDAEGGVAGEGSDDDVNDDDVRPGTVLYVFPPRFSGSYEVHGSSSSDYDDIYRYDDAIDVESDVVDASMGAIDAPPPHQGTGCLLEMGRKYDGDDRVVQYALLRREDVELGNVDVHRGDFAYRSVLRIVDADASASASTASSSSYAAGDGGEGRELETRDRPGMVKTIASPPRSSHRRNTWNDDGGGDQQVSFRWWSWVSHISQIFHPNAAIGSDPSQPSSHDYLDLPYQSIMYEEDGKRPFAGGSHGEIWRARRRCPIIVGGDEETTANATKIFPSCDDGRDLIVKRLKIERGYSVLEAGLREVYFGELLAREVESSSMFTTYVDHFFREGVRNVAELWIVYENAGESLRSFLYTAVDAGGFMLYQHSAFWRRLRRGIAGDAVVPFHRKHNNVLIDDHMHKETRDHEGGSTGGRELLREILKQLITAVAFLNERGIVHRDIKPSNIMCKTTPASDNGSIPRKIETIRCLLGDFSSAWDEFASRNLYIKGPSSKEQTDEYAPPEVLFDTTWIPFFHEHPTSYDSWSIGVVALELLLGTPNVFSVDQRTTALLTNRLQKVGASSLDIQRALYLAALSQFCIFVPTESEEKSWPLRRGDPLYDVNFVKDKCTLNDFHSALQARDPLGIGFGVDENELLHLVWRLLAWDPLERLSASEALDHPYFTARANHRLTFIRTDLLANVPGMHNALEHQTLDPKFDISHDIATITEFVCPYCNKVFADHNSCQRHARSRKHALFCTYDRSQLPHCLHAHSMLPTHPTSGYCDIQGRRKTIEDFHTVHLGPMHQFYGVFDGHLGNLASKYAASSFYMEIEEYLSNVDDRIRNQTSQLVWREEVVKQITQSFEDLHVGIIKAVELSPGGVMDESGTTATILYVSSLAVVIANVGDSRAVMSRWLVNEIGIEYITAMQLTIDHIASSHEEKIHVLEKGGFVSESGGIDRVMGSLAVSRSLGDIKLASFLSRIPHVLVMTKDEVLIQCGKVQPLEDSLPCFIILASDGLWDVMTNQEAVDLAWQVIEENKNGTAYQDAAEVLTQEAYVRGSSDNIGVCIVAIT